MARLLPRAATEQEEHAYYEWAKKYFDKRCDHCGAWVPEDTPQVHDVWGKPRTVYCSEYCYNAEQRTPLFLNEEI